MKLKLIVVIQTNLTVKILSEISLAFVFILKLIWKVTQNLDFFILVKLQQSQDHSILQHSSNNEDNADQQVLIQLGPGGSLVGLVEVDDDQQHDDQHGHSPWYNL